MKNSLYFFIIFFVTVCITQSQAQIITTIAGFSGAGYNGDGGPATAKLLYQPSDVAVDGAGNVYIADSYNNRIRKVNAAGIISTLAGTGTAGFGGDGGPATAALLHQPTGIAADKYGNVFIADGYNGRLRLVNTSGIISTIAGTGGGTYSTGDGGPATAASFTSINSVAIDASGNIYIPDGYQVRKINTSGIIMTIAGSGAYGNSGDGGPATAATFKSIQRLSIDIAGNLYVSDGNIDKIRKVNTSGIITTFAGTGIIGFSGDGLAASIAEFRAPEGLAIDGVGNIYISDVNNARVRKINPLGIIGTYAGNGGWGFGGDGGPAIAATFYTIGGIATDSAGNLYIADLNNNRIRKVWNVNHVPYFIGGTKQTINVCENAGSVSINSLLKIVDLDFGQVETWSAVATPMHGILVAGSTQLSMGDTVIPVGLSYTPATGYVGNDSFKVCVSDSIASDTIIIYVTTNPISPIVGSAAECIGGTINLSDGASGGAWYSSNTAIATVGSSTGIVFGKALGTATITYKTTAGCAALTTVTVNYAVSLITGVFDICEGTTTALTDATVAGTWSSGKTTIATVGLTGIVIGVAGGTATISYSLGSGCTVGQTVTVNTAPTPITGSAAVCIGGTINLSDGVSGGAWTSSNTSVATISPGGTATGIIPGTTTISYTLTGGCMATKIISVNPTPTAITGPSTVCAGSAITLSDAIGGGSWSPAVGVVFTVGTSTGVVTGVSGGTATVTYALGASCAVSKTITVYPLAPVTGATSVCKGQTTILSDLTPGGTWSSPGYSSILSIGSTTGIVTGVALGTAVITYTLPTGCAATYLITVNSMPPAITGTTSVCSGASTALSNATGGGTWTSSNISKAAIGTTTGIVTGVAAGTATITYSIGTGCNATIPITVNPLPAAITGASYVCAGSTIVLSDAAGGWWNSPDATVLVGVTSGIVSGVSAGTATVSYVATTGCVATKTITINPLPSSITGSNNICISATTTLSDMGGGVWSATGGSITIGTTGIVTGKSIGTASVSYTLLTGCATTLLITVHPLPSLIIGGTNVCVSQVLTVSDSIAGGTWSSPAYAGIVSIGLTTGAVTGISGGTAVITYTTGAGCTTTKAVTVNPAPAPITGVKNLCEGGATLFVYDADTPKGVWSSTLVTITSGGLVTTTTAGAAMVTYTLPTGCYATAAFTVNPLPSPITGINFVCTGSTITLRDAATGGTWAASGGIATISSAGVVSGKAAGTAVITYTLPTGCMTTDTIIVYPTPNPITGLSNVCLNATTTFSDSLSGGAWSSSSVGIAAVSSVGAVSGIAVGSAMITYTTTGGCMAVKAVTVLSLPDVYTIYGGGSFCAGDTGVHVKLNWSVTGFKYLLYDGSVVMDSLNGKGDSLDYGLETTGGIYTVVSVNKVTGCSINMSGSATVTVIPLAIPAINMLMAPGDTVCDGTPVTYTAIPVNGGTHPTYQWRINGILISDTFNNYSYTPVYADVVTALMTSNAACATPVRTYTSVPMSVVAPVAPAITVTADPGINIGKGQSVTFMATVTNGVPALTYQWLVNNVAMAGETNTTFTSNSLADNDVVSCEVTSNGICIVSATAAGMQMDVSSEGVTSPQPSFGNHSAGLMMTVYPNPNEGVFMVRGRLGGINDETFVLEITDIPGQVVYKDKVIAKNGIVNEKISISSTIASGMYLLNVRSEGGNYVIHIVVAQ